MLKWAAIFFVIALIAGGLGFSGIAEGAAGIAQILFYIFLALCIAMVLIGIFVAKKIT
ncbi:MAG: DUF1328 domain-containing protein [Nitrospira sp.]|nr:DUF1328 domain-containing protein [Nitrospira sp.]MCA9455146.1 DUF1328 domain-containing protein [Nitrospira sp.]